MNRADIKPDSKLEMRQEGRGENKQEKQHETKKQTMIEIQQQTDQDTKQETKQIKNEETKSMSKSDLSINVEFKMCYAAGPKDHSIATASWKNTLTSERSHSPEPVVQSASILSSSCGSLQGPAFDEVIPTATASKSSLTWKEADMKSMTGLKL